MAHVVMHCAQCCIFAAVGFIIIRLILKWLYLIGLKKRLFNADQYCLQFWLLLDLQKYNWLLLYRIAWGLILNDHWLAEVKSEGSQDMWHKAAVRFSTKHSLLINSAVVVQHMGAVPS